MLSERESVNTVYAMDCGRDFGITQGFFNKITTRRGTGLSEPLDQKRVDQIRSGGRKKEPAGNSSSGGSAAMAGGKNMPVRAELGPRATVRRTEGTGRWRG